MNAMPRPASVTVLACIYLTVGVIGFCYHLNEFAARPVFHQDAVWIELTEALAIVCGVFLIRGQSWARWLALAWMIFHVGLSAFGARSEFFIHLLFCAVIAWILFRPPARRFFQPRHSPL
jgi:hypothetical protein